MSNDEKQALLPLKSSKDDRGKAKYTLVIHGGAGTMDRSRSTPELRAQYKAALSRALLAGYEVLSSGGEAMDAVVAAVSSMEGMCISRLSRWYWRNPIIRLSTIQFWQGCSLQCRWESVFVPVLSGSPFRADHAIF